MFGTATTEDVQVLAKHIDSLTKHELNMDKNLQQQSGHLSSFMAKVDNRFNNLVHGLIVNHDAVEQLAMQVPHAIQEAERAILALTSIWADQTQKSSILQKEFEELKIGVAELANGKLSPLLISPQAPKQSIHQLQELLSKNYPNFHLTEKDPAYYYAENVFSRHSSVLYITIKFPLSTMSSPLDLFKILT